MYDAIKALGIQENIRSRENPLGLVPDYDNDSKIDRPEQEPSELETKTGILNHVTNIAKKAITATAAAAMLFYCNFGPSEIYVQGQTRREGHIVVTEILKIKKPTNLIELIQKDQQANTGTEQDPMFEKNRPDLKTEHFYD